MTRYPTGHPWNPAKQGRGRPDGSGKDWLDRLEVGQAASLALAENDRRKRQGLDHRTRAVVIERVAKKYNSSKRQVYRHLQEWESQPGSNLDMPGDLSDLWANLDLPPDD